MNFFENVLSARHSDEAQSYKFFKDVVEGKIDPITLAAVLGGLKVKGVEAEEVAGAAFALRDSALKFERGDEIIVDSCGTGGDGSNTINISTTAAFVAAACGLKMAKHGNRSVSSRSGSADLLERLGINLTPSPEVSRSCLQKTNLCFLFAPQYHAGVRHAMNVRKTLKTRTLFNILGPLTNPASPDIQLLGVYTPNIMELMANALHRLGVRHAMVVHGSGLDEIAVHGVTNVAEVTPSGITHYSLTPESFGVKPYDLQAIAGGSPEQNAEHTLSILQGNGIPAHVDAVAVNVAALLKMSGKVDSFSEGAAMAKETMNSGTAMEIVESLAELSNV